MSDDHLKGQRQEFTDQQHELAGIGHKTSRFYSEGKSERSRQEKARKASAERILDALATLRLDPVYEEAFQAANTAIDNAQSALDAALAENAQLIADLEDRAVKLPDGRAVFIRADGTVETADGEIIPIEIMVTLDIPDDAPTIEEYDAARERRRELGGYAEDIDRARDEVNDPDNPASEPRLKDITKDMDDIIRDIQKTPDVKTAFDVAVKSSPEARGDQLILSLPKIGE